MSDIVERLRSGPIRTGDTEDGEYELFDIEEAAQTMREAAVEIARLRAEVERLMQLAILMGRDAINSRREALKGGNDEVGLPNENHQSATAGA